MRRALRAANGRVWSRAAMTFVLAAAGGGLFEALSMPAGWISGGILAVALSSFAGVETEVPRSIRPLIFLFLGIFAGSGARPETLEQIVTWPISFAILAVCVPLVIAASYSWLRQARWDRNTALLASVPGGLSFIIAAAEATRADMRKVAITQSLRLLILVETVPLIVLAIGASRQAAAAGRELIGLGDIALLAVVGTIGGLLVGATGLPGGLILGGLLGSATLYVSGIVDGALPHWVVVPGMVALAAIAGSRFRPGDRHLLPAIVGPGIIAFLIAAIISFAGAALVTLLLGVELAQTMLAFAPGGLDALTILAFAMNLDPAYVAAHHTARYLFLALVIPFIAQRMNRGG
jgi:membrane AbrB-like protein